MSGPVEVRFAPGTEDGVIVSGSFFAEVDVKLKDADDGVFSCPNAAKVRGCDSS